ncbi:MAG TPA: hypothetical protein VFW00_03240 [Rhodocyclaceae bacterium]|nr:hypothetical protein [Rhodocyclaceae bacterium]
MKCFTYAAIAFASIFLPSFSGAQESQPTAFDAAGLRPIKTGDKLTYQRTLYLQPEIRGAIVLSKEPGKPFEVTVQSDDGHERILKFSNGMEVYDNTFAQVGWIDNTGARKTYDSSAILHWMPSGELKPGMEWTSSTDWKLKSTNYGGECTNEVKYKGTSAPTSRDVLINNKMVHVDAIEITLDGRLKSVSSCFLTNGEQDIVKKFVYSKALNLVLEKTNLSHNDFQEMVGGTENRVESIIAIRQN